jgi:hypothetical protein
MRLLSSQMTLYYYDVTYVYTYLNILLRVMCRIVALVSCFYGSTVCLFSAVRLVFNSIKHKIKTKRHHRQQQQQQQR